MTELPKLSAADALVIKLAIKGMEAMVSATVKSAPYTRAIPTNSRMVKMTKKKFKRLLGAS